MDDFEKFLKKMPVKRPEDELRNRIFSEPATVEPVTPDPDSREGNRFPRRIPIGWAAALVCVVGAASFFAGRTTSSEPVPAVMTETRTSVQLEIVEVSEDDQVLFDFTEPAEMDFGAPVRIDIQSGQES